MLKHGLGLVGSGVDGESHALSTVTFLLAVKPCDVLEFWVASARCVDLQIGVATVTCMAICGGGTTLLLGFGMNPESTPPTSASQGVVKADCVAVWFCCMNVKITISPIAALIESGVYANPADPPTMTWETVSIVPME